MNNNIYYYSEFVDHKYGDVLSAVAKANKSLIWLKIAIETVIVVLIMSAIHELYEPKYWLSFISFLCAFMTAEYFAGIFLAPIAKRKVRSIISSSALSSQTLN